MRYAVVQMVGSLALLVALGACGSSASPPADVAHDAGATDAPTGADVDQDVAADPGMADPGATDPGTADLGRDVGSDADTDDDAQAAADVATATLDEEEPNDGGTLTEFNALPLAATAKGAIGVAQDADIFRVETQAGHVYRAVLTAPAPSALAGHLTVMDTGRGTKAAGEDYVKMAVAAPDVAVVEWLAMGAGGHFVIVRDDRNVEGGSTGSADHTYELVVTERALADVSGAGLAFPSTFDEALPSPGSLRLFAFSGTEGQDVLLDLQAKGDIDARLFVFAEVIGSWIARNDDRSMGDADPLIDAPLTESGAMQLVVENVEPTATSLGFTLSGAAP